MTLGVTASVPIWHRKYDAMTSEASREHLAARAGEEEVALLLPVLGVEVERLPTPSRHHIGHVFPLGGRPNGTEHYPQGVERGGARVGQAEQPCVLKSFGRR